MELVLCFFIIIECCVFLFVFSSLRHVPKFVLSRLVFVCFCCVII